MQARKATSSAALAPQPAAKKRRRVSYAKDPATAYAQDVCSGKIVAGPHVRDACARHLRDLDTGPARGLTWSLEHANDALEFFRRVLFLNGGEFEGHPFEPDDWQCFVIGSVFGWLGPDGFRRFRNVYIETGKGSGKSPLVAGIGLYCLVADGEDRAEVYAAATKRDQAAILFRDAVAMVDQSPVLRDNIVRSGAKGKEYNLAYHARNSFFRTLSSDDGQSGPRPHCALLDEVHEHRTGHVVEMVSAGTKSRKQALIVMITNSGTSKTSVCWEKHEYGAKVCAGLLVDDAFFAYICALDEDDTPLTDERCWLKANPSLKRGIPGLKYLREQVVQARGMPAKESVVRRLNFCQWVESASPWLSGRLWMAASESYDENLLRDRRCWGGLDLSSTTDLTAFVLTFEPTEDDPHWRQLPFFWLPEEGLSEKADQDRVPYVEWKRAGHLRTTPGRAVSKLHVLHEISAICAPYDVQSIGYDDWRIADLIALQEQEGVTLPPLQGFRQGYKSMGPAVEEFESRFISGALKHPGNPVFTWNAANAVVEQDPAGNKKPAKHKATGRIDGIVASIMANGISTKTEDDGAGAPMVWGIV